MIVLCVGKMLIKGGAFSSIFLQLHSRMMAVLHFDMSSSSWLRSTFDACWHFSVSLSKFTHAAFIEQMGSSFFSFITEDILLVLEKGLLHLSHGESFETANEIGHGC